MFEELPEYLTVDWLKIGGFLKGADDNQNVMIEEVGSIAIDDFVSEQETTLSVVTNQFNFVHIIVSGEPFKTLKVIPGEKNRLRQTFERRSKFLSVINSAIC